MRSPAASSTCVDRRAPYGTYNLTGGGEPSSWADVAREVYRLAGADPDAVTPVSTDEYFASANGPVAPRPRYSVLDLARIEATGSHPVMRREPARLCRPARLTGARCGRRHTNDAPFSERQFTGERDRSGGHHTSGTTMPR